MKEIIKKCKNSINITINNHRDYYESVTDYFEKIKNTFDPEIYDDIDNELLKKMIELNTIIEIQFYPNTPIGSYTVYHYDYDMALDIVKEILHEES